VLCRPALFAGERPDLELAELVLIHEDVHRREALGEGPVRDEAGRAVRELRAYTREYQRAKQLGWDRRAERADRMNALEGLIQVYTNDVRAAEQAKRAAVGGTVPRRVEQVSEAASENRAAGAAQPAHPPEAAPAAAPPAPPPSQPSLTLEAKIGEFLRRNTAASLNEALKGGRFAIFNDPVFHPESAGAKDLVLAWKASARHPVRRRGRVAEGVLLSNSRPTAPHRPTATRAGGRSSDPRKPLEPADKPLMPAILNDRWLRTEAQQLHASSARQRRDPGRWSWRSAIGGTDWAAIASSTCVSRTRACRTDR
jgi:hypothetical protein